MPGKKFTFREILNAACRSYPHLWREHPKNGTQVLNLAALARHYAERGHPVTQPNLHRLYNGQQHPGKSMVEATHAVFRVPRAILRGEPLSAEMEERLGKVSLDTLLLAERLERLEHDDYKQVAEFVCSLEKKRAQMRQIVESSPNVHPLPKRP